MENKYKSIAFEQLEDGQMFYYKGVLLKKTSAKQASSVTGIHVFDGKEEVEPWQDLSDDQMLLFF